MILQYTSFHALWMTNNRLHNILHAVHSYVVTSVSQIGFHKCTRRQGPGGSDGVMMQGGGSVVTQIGQARTLSGGKRGLLLVRSIQHLTSTTLSLTAVMTAPSSSSSTFTTTPSSQPPHMTLHFWGHVQKLTLLLFLPPSPLPHQTFLSDPGVPGVRSMGPDLTPRLN